MGPNHFSTFLTHSIEMEVANLSLSCLAHIKAWSGQLPSHKGEKSHIAQAALGTLRPKQNK